MFCMGQNQSEGVELEDKVVESQPLRPATYVMHRRTMKVRSYHGDSSNFGELLCQLTITNKSHYPD